MYFIGDLQEDLDEMLKHQKEIELKKYKVKLSLLERDIYAKSESLTQEDKQKISELFTQYRTIDIDEEYE
ncbi:hypothetical protein R4J03_09165 [Brachyspira intermedia]|uniref:hypothetical protein n=1 Tax=Brachyspira intermedia TaxID=84377 RepID=UPI00262D81E4|nr:hypothetical protein [uncultured Brachyspira sp.]